MKSSTDRCVPAPLRRQRGIATILVAIVLLLTVSTGLLTALTLSGSGIVGTGLQNDAIEAIYLAESGVERAVQRYGAGATCDAALAEAGLAFGRGSFSIAAGLTSAFDGVTPLPGNQCRVGATGVIAGSDVRRVVEAIIVRGSSLLFGDTNNEGHFPDAADFSANWATQVLTSPDGSSSRNADNCPGATCADTLAGSGSLHMQTNATSANEVFAGYRQRTLTTPIAGGQNIDVEIGYLLDGSNINGATSLSVTLFDTAASVETTVWSFASGAATGGWALGTASNVVLPAGRTYDRIRLRFDLREQGNHQVLARFDYVRIVAAGGGGAAAAAGIKAWREVRS